MSRDKNHAEIIARLINSLYENRSLEHIKGVLEQNAELEDENKKLKITNDQFDRKIAQYVTKYDAMKSKFDAKDSELDGLFKEKNDLVDRNSVLENQYQTATLELIDVREELRRLRRFAVKLNTLSDATESLLNGLFFKARNVAEQFFGVDFTEETLADLTSWETLRKHDAFDRNMIPIPLTNSVVGKQMRTAAFLAIIAVELSRYIFQPVYIVEDADELCEALSDLAKDATEQEAYVRSVLLAAFRGKQAQDALQRRLDRTADTIFSFVGGLFGSSAAKGALRMSLGDLCREASIEWQRIQSLKEKIEPSFRFFHSDDDEWKPLVFKTPGLVSPASPKAQLQNSPTPKAPNKRSAKQGQQQAAKPDEETAPDLADAVIWPSFWVASLLQYDDETALARGYVLCESQIATAKEEEKTQVVPGTRRAARRDVRRARTMSTGVVGQMGMRPSSSSGGEVGSLTGTGSAAAPPGGGGGGMGSGGSGATVAGVANANGGSFLSGKGGGGPKGG
ncbi:hypothetical protein B0H67DRAFT_649888 [Lasiosphaeris hirsuta]|uniref:MEI5 protein n=1 Tax=Lasiosphaeris hirsuta TaxID=260670 RepID=A0AA40DJ64_9PEZI|nr:hypothetical protein B0H67DRAFT_649888 [Lasiosphaeris hirsuta]